MTLQADECPALTGQVLWPNHPDYGKARLGANHYPSKNSHPDAIVYCKSTQNVQNAVRWARCKKIPVRIRSGSHNHEGFSTGNGLIIDVSHMKKVEIDHQNIATIQPGITGGELYHFLSKKGLTQVGGTCANVGIGGMGPLLRKHGLTCDTLIAFEIVNAKGDILYVTKDNEYKDLFWACCGGGGGNFGVVTSILLQLYPAKKVTWFNIGWDWNQPVEEVINTWQQLFANGDKKWFSHLDIWVKEFPVQELNKQPLKVLGVYYGTPEEDKNSLAELDALRTRLLPYTVGDYVGNPDRSLKDYLSVYYGDNAERLRHIKRKYDPDSLFQFEQGISPAEKGPF